MVTALDKNTALVLIDLQTGIVQGALINPIDDVMANAARLIGAFRRAGLPIVFVRVHPKRGKVRADAAMPIADPLPEAFLELSPQLKTAPGDIFIIKQSWGAFYNTPLHDELQARGVTGIVLGGVSTSIGVEGTARGAAERGYNIAFATDAMTDRTASAQEHSIKTIFPRIGEVDTTDNIISVLEKRE